MNDPQEERFVPHEAVSTRPIKTISIGVVILLVIVGLAALGLLLHLGMKFGLFSWSQPRTESVVSGADPQAVNAFSQAGADDAARWKSTFERQQREEQQIIDQLKERLKRLQERGNGQGGNETTTTGSGYRGAYGQGGTGTGTGTTGDDAAAQRRQQADDRQTAREKRIQDSLHSPGVILEVAAHKDSEAKRPQSDEDEKPELPAQSKKKDALDEHGFTEYDKYVGELHKVFVGRHFEVVIENRLTGDAEGPVKALLVSDFYSQNHQEVLVPQGTEFIGTTSAVNSQDQRRLFAAFNWMRMPDGFMVSLDQFQGLSAEGDIGLQADVNHHYMQIFGVSLVVGAIGGAAQIGNNGNGSYGYDPTVGIRNGVTQQTSQEAMQILNRFLSRLPTISKKPGAISDVYISGTFDLPLYANHRMDPDL